MTERVSHEQIYRELGSIEARLSSLEKTQGTMVNDVKAMRSQLDLMKGGRLALFGLLAAAASLGGLITHMVGWIRP